MKIKDPHSDHDGDDSMVTSNMMAQKTVGNILRKDMDKNGYKYVEKMFCNLISFQVKIIYISNRLNFSTN